MSDSDPFGTPQWVLDLRARGYELPEVEPRQVVCQKCAAIVAHGLIDLHDLICPGRDIRFDSHLTHWTSFAQLQDHLEREHQTAISGGDLTHALKVHRRAHP